MSTKSPVRNPRRWYRPTVSPRHGAYVMLVVSFVTGAAAAQHWTWATTLALVCAYCGFQAEHPFVSQLKRWGKWKPQWLIWFGIYLGIAGAIALWLFWHSQGNWHLLIIYGVAITTALVDALSVKWRQQKSVWNELVTFFAVCLSAPLAYVVTAGTLSQSAIALWLLNGVFFSSAIFSVKLRKVKEASIVPGLIFHGVAAGIVFRLWQVQWLSPVTAVAFSMALLKFGLIALRLDWYRHAKIQQVAKLETIASVLFLAIASLSLLPSHLN
ncbi:MAG: YwiC-like family protein [Cyanobacteria bacterium J06648_11]